MVSGTQHKAEMIEYLGSNTWMHGEQKIPVKGNGVMGRAWEGSSSESIQRSLWVKGT